MYSAQSLSLYSVCHLTLLSPATLSPPPPLVSPKAVIASRRLASTLDTTKMETVNDLVSQLETCVCDDLDTLSAISEGVECDEIIDNIRINLSSRLSELRLLITDKVRIRQMAINQDNKLHAINGYVAVLINGVVRNPNSLRSKGRFAVVWNRHHSLNLSMENPLTIMTPDSSILLALLATCNQMAQLKRTTFHILTPSQTLKNTIDCLSLWHTQNFRTSDNSTRPNSHLLSLIHRIIEENNFKIEIFQNPVPSAISSLYENFLEISKQIMNDGSVALLTS